MIVPNQSICEKHAEMEPVAHSDGCHWFAWTYKCKACGHPYFVVQQRDLDEHFPCWAEDDCEQCRKVEQGEALDLTEEMATVQALHGLYGAVARRLGKRAGDAS